MRWGGYEDVRQKGVGRKRERMLENETTENKEGHLENEGNVR